MKSKQLLLTLLGSTAFTASATAASIIGWDYNTIGESGLGDRTQPDLVDSNLNSTTSVFSYGSGIVLPTTKPGFGLDAIHEDTSGLDAFGNALGPAGDSSIGQLSFRTNESPNAETLAQAITQNRYIAYTINANSGFEFDATGFGFKTYVRSADKNDRMALYSSVDNYATMIGSEFDFVGQGGTASPDAGIDYTEGGTVNLALDAQDFTGLSDITFRLYVWGTDSSTTSAFVQFDKISVEGSIVPEPSSAALLGLGGLALILRRRK